MKSRGRSDHQPPTVDIDRLTVDVRGIRAAEERYQLAHLAWLTRATERNCGHDGVSDRPWAGYVLHAIRVRKTGADAVYVDLVGRKLGGEDLREEDEAGLRNGIGAEAGQALAAGDRADVDDTAALALLDEGAADGFGHKECPVEVDVEHAAPLALFESEERDAVAPAACGGVVDEEVYSPELASGFVYEAVAVVRLGDVDDEGESTVA